MVAPPPPPVDPPRRYTSSVWVDRWPVPSHDLPVACGCRSREGPNTAIAGPVHIRSVLQHDVDGCNVPTLRCQEEGSLSVLVGSLQIGAGLQKRCKPLHPAVCRRGVQLLGPLRLRLSQEERGRRAQGESLELLGCPSGPGVGLP
eukprot:scaffold8026_cov34-Prasinocladus_malaysianus.AAC.3